MTILRTPNRFQPDPLIEAFPGLLTFRGSPPDGAGISEIEGDVDADALERILRRQIHVQDPTAPVYVDSVDRVGTAHRRYRIPWPTVIAAASGSAATLIVEGVLWWR